MQKKSIADYSRHRFCLIWGFFSCCQLNKRISVGGQRFSSKRQSVAGPLNNFREDKPADACDELSFIVAFLVGEAFLML